MITGSLQKKKDTYYTVIRLQDLNGVARQEWKTTGIRADEKKAYCRATKILSGRIADYEKQNKIYSKIALFTEWLDSWLEQKKALNEIRQSTFECYKIYMDKHIKPYFNPLKLTVDKVSSTHIQAYYIEKHKTLSAKTIKKHSVILRGALQDAVKKKLIYFNPVDGADLPKQTERFKGKALTAEQVNTLLDVLTVERHNKRN